MPHPPMPPGKKHLVYRDWPKMPQHVWEWVKDQLQPFELQVLSEAVYQKADGKTLARGQMWVHLDGLATLKEAFERDRDQLFPKLPDQT